jgi:signal transduction histidine kinase
LKILRAYILADTLLLAALGLGMAFIHPGSFPVVYLEVEVSRSAASLGFVAAGLGALALVLWMSTDLPLIADRRRLALGLSFANLLIAVVAFLQADLWGRALGWSLAAVFLGLAAGLAWTGLRPRKPAEIAAEIAALKIPAEIRQGLLRQIEEAAAQEERNRLARDLHDSIKQQLFSINVGAAAAQERWDRDPEGARKSLADVRRSAREATVEMQAMLHQLRPEALSTAGLTEALREQCEALGYRSGAEVTLEIGEPVPEDRMPPGAPETLFRMAQEMLANVARHARARQVRLWLGRQDEAVVLRIEDDGQGFDPAAEVSGMGLRNLKERAESMRGKLEVASTPGSGARLAVRIPLTLPVPEPVERRWTGAWDGVYIIVWSMVLLLSWRVPPIKQYLDAHESRMYLIMGMLVTLTLAVRFSQRFSLRYAQTYALAYTRHQGGGLSILFSTCWLFLGPSGDGRIPEEWWYWVAQFLLLLLGIIELIKLHRISEVRRFWRKGARTWLMLVLLMEAEILLALGLAAFAPDLLVLHPIEAFFLLVLGAGFAYVASRQPRTEGAPA